MSKKILITGGSGQLARCISLANKSDQLYIPSRAELDVTYENRVKEYLNDTHPDIVIHLASLTRGDECAKNPEKAYNVNVEGTKNVAFICNKLNIPILLVSTNEVFDGTRKRPYIESDLPNPITMAGKTKYLSEIIVRQFTNKFYIVRTMWLYSEWSNNFIHSIVQIARNRKEIAFTSDEIGSPTNSHDLAHALLQLIGTNRYGCYHIVNKGSVSRSVFGRRVLTKLGLVNNIHIKDTPLNSFARLSKPPLSSSLTSNKLQDVGIDLRDWSKALDDFLKQNPI